MPNRPARPRGPGRHHDERRAEIADAVLAGVVELGLDGVSLTEVARRAGVSPGRVQHYFPAKQRLIEAAFDRGNELSEARIRERAGGPLEEARPAEVLRIVLDELIPYDAASTAHLRVRQSFIARALADEAIAAKLRALYAGFHDRMAALLSAEQRAGTVPEGLEPRAAARALVAQAEGLASYVLLGVVDAAEARGQLERSLAELYG